jgi:hypothetical protein
MVAFNFILLLEVDVQRLKKPYRSLMSIHCFFPFQVIVGAINAEVTGPILHLMKMITEIYKLRSSGLMYKKAGVYPYHTPPPPPNDVSRRGKAM